MKKRISLATGYRTDRVKSRELERIKKLRAEGATYAEIAECLERSERTIRQQLKEKPSVTRTTETEPIDTQRQISQPDSKEILEHDNNIFKEYDDILSEKDVRDITYRLLSRNELHVDNGTKLAKFQWFTSYEGKKYVSTVLRRECENFLDSVYELGVFVDKHFYSADIEHYSELWVPSSHQYNHQWEPEIWEEYHKLEAELHGITEKILEAYKSYRAAVRTTLIL